MEESTPEFEEKPIREWDDIIPEEQRRKIEEEEKQREMEDIFMLPRSRSSIKRVRAFTDYSSQLFSHFPALTIRSQPHLVHMRSRLRPMTVTAMWAPSWSTTPQALRARRTTVMMTRSQRREADLEPEKITLRVSPMLRSAGKGFCAFSCVTKKLVWADLMIINNNVSIM